MLLCISHGLGARYYLGEFKDERFLPDHHAMLNWARWDFFAPESLLTSGFVHLSTQQQAHLPATRLFAGRGDLLAVYVDPQRLEAPVRWEPGVPDDPPTMRFPHLYGPLPLSAVVEVRTYPPQSDGTFAPLIHSGAGGTSSPSVTDC
jgi:uncharacterized protein (DUF952 family)